MGQRFLSMDEFFQKDLCELLLYLFIHLLLGVLWIKPRVSCVLGTALPQKPIVLLRTKKKLTCVFGTTAWLIQILLRIGGRG